MGYSKYEYINDKKFYTATINASKCSGNQSLINEISECMILSERSINMHIINDFFYNQISQGYCKFIIEKSKFLLEKNKESYTFLVELLEMYKQYSLDSKYECIIEFN